MASASGKRERRPRVVRNNTTTVVDRARDELFRAIRQCGVLGAGPEEQAEWMDDTLAFMAERHPELSRQDLAQLRDTGLRFCQPVIPHGKGHTALNQQDSEGQAEAEAEREEPAKAANAA